MTDAKYLRRDSDAIVANCDAIYSERVGRGTIGDAYGLKKSSAQSATEAIAVIAWPHEYPGRRGGAGGRARGAYGEGTRVGGAGGRTRGAYGEGRRVGG